MDAGGAARAAAAGKSGERRQRRAGAAVVVDQRTEGTRADIVAADEAKPIEPLLVGRFFRKSLSSINELVHTISHEGCRIL
jgi:hypothetical protein